MYERAVKHIVKNLNLNSFHTSDKSNLFLTVFNQTQFTRSEVVECFIDVPKEFDKGDIKL